MWSSIHPRVGRARGLIVAASVALAALWSLGSPAHADEPERLSGGDRIATAVAASGLWDSSEHIVVTVSDDFPDALAAGALAAELEAPLLLTGGGGLDGLVAEEVARLGAGRAWVVGGEAVLGPQVEVDLLARGLDVTRLAGADRFETAARVMAELGDRATIAVAPGEGFPDALSASTFAARLDVPVLLSRRDGVPAATVQAMAEAEPERIIAVGGRAVLSEGVHDELRQVVSDSPLGDDALVSVAGSDRYETSARSVTAALDESTDEAAPVVVTTGADFPDALAAGAVAARLDGYVLLTRPDRLPDVADTLLRAHPARFGSAVVMGGSAAVSDFVAEELAAALTGDMRPEPEPEPQPPPEVVIENGRLSTGEVTAPSRTEVRVVNRDAVAYEFRYLVALVPSGFTVQPEGVRTVTMPDRTADYVCIECHDDARRLRLAPASR